MASLKVLDFGLAKVTASGVSDPEGETRIQSDTQPGMIMGTVAYMSPEQARGKAVDPRTDVWSLGVLLYEMLSRRLPFPGETASDTLANILHREPDSLNIGALPEDLTKIVDRMLAKKLEARYPTMAEAISDLKSLQRRIEFDSELQQTVLRSALEAQTEIIVSPTTAPDSASSRTQEGFWVAVLPFKYPGSNPELEALAEGLSEDIVTGLSRFSYLRVIARSSTSRFAASFRRCALDWQRAWRALRDGRKPSPSGHDVARHCATTRRHYRRQLVGRDLQTRPEAVRHFHGPG